MLRAKACYDKCMRHNQPLLSIGLDIGTSTTQCVFSSLQLENAAPAFSVPRIRIAEKRVLFRAPLRLTPLSAPDTIQTETLRAWLEEDFRSAGLHPEQIGIGAVIITGETARKQNARAVAQALAGCAGEFVVATAGPSLEAVLAGRGSGAAQLSRDRGKAVLNLDIGGGTANLCLFERGEAIATGCLDVGGRLLRRDPATRAVLSFTPQMARIASDCGILLMPGSVLPEEAAARMAGLLEEAAGLRPRTALHDALVLDHALPLPLKADLYTFSGGVSACLYGDEPSPLFADDLGALLGRTLVASRFFTEGRVLRPAETQHATVIGAGAYSMNVSGSTIAYARAPLPLKDLPVGKALLEGPEDIDRLAERVMEQRRILGDPFAIGLAGWTAPSYADIEAIAAQLDAAIPKDDPCPVIVLEHDMAKALGQVLSRRRGLSSPMVCIDGVSLQYGDRIDIGAPLAEGRVLPVVIKTFAFSG